MKNLFGSPFYEDDLAGMEEYDMLAEDIDEELYEEYIDEYGDKRDFF